MKYTKPPLTFDEQVQHLLDLGLQGDPVRMRERLQSVNFYRLSGYLHPSRAADNETFLPGTAFDTVWMYYAFDRRLRLLVDETGRNACSPFALRRKNRTLNAQRPKEVGKLLVVGG